MSKKQKLELTRISEHGAYARRLGEGYHHDGLAVGPPADRGVYTSGQHRSLGYARMLDRAQEFTSRNDFSDYERVLAQLHENGAFLESHEGRLHMPERAVAT